MRVRYSRIIVVYILFANVFTLIGCGGGSGSASNNQNGQGENNSITLEQPDLSVSAGFKQLQFAWEDVDAAEYYRLLVNQDGQSGFTQVGENISADNNEVSVEISVHLFDWVNARYILEACQANNCRQSNEVTLLNEAAQAVGYFKSSNIDSDDRFGVEVALSEDGQVLAVGAIGESSDSDTINSGKDNNDAVDSGAVYIFTRNEKGLWVESAYLKANNSDAGDNFGVALDISADGNTLAVSALNEDSGAVGINGDGNDNSAEGSGAVYVFVNDDGNWSQQAYIKSSNTDQGDVFGISVALSGDGNTLAVGANMEDGSSTGINGADDNDAEMSGAAYVFHREANIWSQQTYLKAHNAEMFDRFGRAVTLSFDGNVLAVSATGEDGGSNTVNGVDNNALSSSGAVYVFTREISIWSQHSYLKVNNSSIGDLLGLSLDLSDDGKVLAIGATGENSNIAGINPINNDDAEDAGAAYIFIEQGNEWKQETFIKASNPSEQDKFGNIVRLNADGNILVVGAFDESGISLGINGDESHGSEASGAVYVFERNTNGWEQRTYIKSNNPDDEDMFGGAVAINADGTILVVGAVMEDGSQPISASNNSDDNDLGNSGAIYVY